MSIRFRSFDRARRLANLFILTALAHAVAPPAAQADTLATKALSDIMVEQFNIEADAFDAFIEVGVASGAQIAPGDPLLFEAMVFDLDDVGQTFTLTAADDPDFAAIVAMLTDGIDNPHYFSRVHIRRKTDTTTGTAFVLPESQFFDTLAVPGPDLQGLAVASIGLTIDSIRMATAGSINFGTFTRQARVDATLTVNGPIPEPATLTLLAPPAALCLAARRRAPAAK